MMPKQTFSAHVDEWVRGSKGRLDAVFRESSQRVIAEMQRPVAEGGRMHVDTGFLRASLQVAVNAPPVPASVPNPGVPTAYNAGGVAMTIAGAEIGDVVTASYSANYAPYREYGANGQEPDAFVRMAALQWRGIVNQVVSELRSGARR